MSEENVEVVRGCYEAFARGDFSFLEEVCDPDIVIDFSRMSSIRTPIAAMKALAPLPRASKRCKSSRRD